MQTSTPLKRAAVVLAVVAALVVAFVGARHLDTAEAHPDDVEQRLADDPAPPLFAQDTITPVATQVAAEAPRAQALLRQWWARHGHRSDDAAFRSWLVTVVPAPPAAATRTAQLSQVAAVTRTRTAAGTRAAHWLAAHGANDVWVAADDAQQHALSASAAATRDRQLKRALGLAKGTADALAAKLQQSSPGVLRPALRPPGVKGGAPGGTCPCSYPSHYAATGAAAQTVLGSTDPARQEQYTRMEAQVDYSRLYLAGGLPSDLDAGALLGDLVGDYVLGTHS
ncbi:MAG: hypothetical protein JWR20_1373 [Marmoricola sp.]|nr:hypothetical protein [Marmoricola sp.]